MNFDSENCTIQDEYLVNYWNFSNKSLTNSVILFDKEFIEIIQVEMVKILHQKKLYKHFVPFGTIDILC